MLVEILIARHFLVLHSVRLALILVSSKLWRILLPQLQEWKEALSRGRAFSLLPEADHAQTRVTFAHEIPVTDLNLLRLPNSSETQESLTQPLQVLR